MSTEKMSSGIEIRFNRLSLLAAILLPLLFVGVVFWVSPKDVADLAAFVLDDHATLWEELPPREEVWSLWDGSIDKDLEGSGDITNPFLIRTAAQLAGWGALVDEGRVESFARLMTNIDLNGLAWNPISQSAHSHIPPWEIQFFCGYFDGNGYVVKNLHAETTASFGFFYKTHYASYIANCSILDASIQARSGCGILVGESGGSIRNCHVSGSIRGMSGLGGMIGRLDSPIYRNNVTSIKHSHASADISGILDLPAFPEMHLPATVGGFVGSANNFYRLDNCRATGRIMAADGKWVGGFAGLLSGLRRSSPSGPNSYYNEDVGAWNSVASVDVIIGGETAGGFVGFVDWNVNIINCLSLGNVEGVSETGGFVGLNYGYIFDSFSVGRVFGKESIGGFIGNNSGPVQVTTEALYPQTGNRALLRNIGRVVSCGWLQSDTVNTYLEGIGEGITEGEHVDLTAASRPGQIAPYNWNQPYAFKPQQYRDAEIVFIHSGESKRLFLDTGGDVPRIVSVKPGKIEGITISYKDNRLTLGTGELKAPAVHIVGIEYRSANGEKAEKRFRLVFQ